jgi:hypothetical protein
VVEHVVLFKWKEGASPDAIGAAIRGLKALKEEIEGIVDLTVGENFSTRSQGYQCGLVVRFTNREALDAYVPHPAHQDVVLNLLAPIREESIAVDYEIRP